MLKSIGNRMEKQTSKQVVILMKYCDVVEGKKPDRQQVQGYDVEQP